jgi:hypothetical protein
VTKEEKQEYLAKAKTIMATTLGKQEALRKLNEVADAINACLFEKFPGIETGVAALVMDKMVSNMIERAMQIASGMGRGNN